MKMLSILKEIVLTNIIANDKCFNVTDEMIENFEYYSLYRIDHKNLYMLEKAKKFKVYSWYYNNQYLYTLSNDFNNLSDEWKKILLKRNGHLIQYIKSPHTDLIWIAMKTNPKAFLLLSNSLDELILKAIKINPSVIKYIYPQPKKLQWLALKTDARSFMHLINPTEEMKLFAVAHDGFNIININNPTDEMKWLAIKSGIHF